METKEYFEKVMMDYTPNRKGRVRISLVILDRSRKFS